MRRYNSWPLYVASVLAILFFILTILFIILYTTKPGKKFINLNLKIFYLR